MWIVYALASAFFAGLTAILAKIGVKKTDSTVATAVRTIVVLIFSWLMVFIVGSYDGIFKISSKTLIFLILSGMSTGFSWLSYFKALQLGSINKVVAVDKSSIVLTILLSFIVLNEKISTCKIIGMILITVGSYLMIQKKEEDRKLTGKSWFFYASLSVVFASLTTIFGKIGIVGVESNLGTGIRTFVVLIMSWLIVFVTGKEKTIKDIPKKEFVPIILSGFATGASWLCFYKALQQGEASLVVPIDKLSILVTVAFSYFVFREKLNKKELLGLTSIVLGTLVMLV